MSEAILLVSAILGVENCASVISKQFGFAVETVSNRKDAIAALRRNSYALAVLDSSLIETDPESEDLLFRYSGLAIPLEINFAIYGCGRLVREIRAALSRRQLEQALAARAATTSLESRLRDTVTGLLLQSELALAEPAIPPQLADKLRVVVELAGNLRQTLNPMGAAM